jgi:hypothetical protein
VRADNELNLRVFRQLGYSPRHFVVLGRDDYLYERGYVDSFNRRDEAPIEELEARVRRLVTLQRFLEARGKMLLVLITPSKAMLYPEYIPDGLIDTKRQRIPSSYDKLLTLLQREGIDYFDAEGYLASLKATLPFTLFTNSGIHWSDPAACEVTARVLERFTDKLRRPLPHLHCQPYAEAPSARGEDLDLLRVCNLWSPERLIRPAFYAQPRVVGGGRAPSVLIVGGSFNRAFMRYLRRARVNDVAFYYYYKRLEYRGRTTPLDHSAIDFESQVFSKDAVVVEVNIEVATNIGFGFIEDAARAIESANK